MAWHKDKGKVVLLIIASNSVKRISITMGSRDMKHDRDMKLSTNRLFIAITVSGWPP